MMREKKRYLKIKVEAEKPVGETEAKHLVYEAVFSMLSELGASKASAFLKEWSEEKQEGIVRCANAYVYDVTAALAAKRYWRGQDVAVRVEKISGSIKGLE